MAQLVKFSKYEGLSSDPQDLCTKLGVVTRAYNQHQESRARRNLGTPSQPKPSASSRFSERLCLNKNKVERHWGKCWTSTSDLHAKTCTHIQPPPHTHTQTYSKWLSWVSRKRLWHLTNIDSPHPQENRSVFSPCYVKQCSSCTSYSCENIETV